MKSLLQFLHNVKLTFLPRVHSVETATPDMTQPETQGTKTSSLLLRVVVADQLSIDLPVVAIFHGDDQQPGFRITGIENREILKVIVALRRKL